VAVAHNVEDICHNQLKRFDFIRRSREMKSTVSSIFLERYKKAVHFRFYG